MKSEITYIRPYTKTKARAEVGDIIANILLLASMGAGLAAVIVSLLSF